MKIFFPFERSENRYLDEIENCFQGSFFYGGLDDYKKEYDIVNIHWPEAIFDWVEPTDEELMNLQEHLKKWKKHSRIVYTRHNEYTHYSRTDHFVKLYDLILKNLDGIIHLGQYSLDSLKDEFLNIAQTVIYHPLYETIPNAVTKYEARKKLNITMNAKVILVFGAIRSFEEQQMIIRAFRMSKIKNKVLLIPRFPHFISNKVPIRFKKYYKFIMRHYYENSRKYCFYNRFVATEEIQYYLNACDVVLIARKESLNSGNIFLGYTFNKVVVAPRIGNMTEAIDFSKFPDFDPNRIKSISNALKEGILSSEKSNPNKNNTNIQKCSPQIIANQYYKFFEKTLKLNVN